jgi:hypothetical protein
MKSHEFCVQLEWISQIIWMRREHRLAFLIQCCELLFFQLLTLLLQVACKHSVLSNRCSSSIPLFWWASIQSPLYSEPCSIWQLIITLKYAYQVYRTHVSMYGNHERHSEKSAQAWFAGCWAVWKLLMWEMHVPILFMWSRSQNSV